MKKHFLILFIFITSCIGQTNGQNIHNAIKINSEINSLLKGDGFSFNSIGYERHLNDKNTVGFWLGGKLKTSQLELGKDKTASNFTNFIFTLDYYYYLYKHNQNGVYLSPAIFYENIFQNKDNDHSNGYGLNMSIGYRYVFNRITFDCALFSTFGYTKQTNNVYVYRSKEIKPIDIKISVGYSF